MEQISTKIGVEASHISAPDDAEPSLDNMMRLDAEFREKQNQLQTLIEQRKEKYVIFSCWIIVQLQNENTKEKC